MKYNRNREYRTKKPVNIPLGTPLGIHDYNGAELRMGDFVTLLETPYYGERKGRIDEVAEKRFVRVALPNWYCHYLPLDDGAKMRIHKMTDEEIKPWLEWYAQTYGADDAQPKPHHAWQFGLKRKRRKT